MLGEVRPLVWSPVASCFCQRTLPSFRSRQSRSRFLFASGLETKIVSPQTHGVEPLKPGSGIAPLDAGGRAPFGSESLSRRVDPLNAGPRQCGQFSACAVRARAETARVENFSGYSRASWRGCNPGGAGFFVRFLLRVPRPGSFISDFARGIRRRSAKPRQLFGAERRGRRDRLRCFSQISRPFARVGCTQQRLRHHLARARSG